MWIFENRKESKIEKKEDIKVKLGESFVLRPGESAFSEIPIPAEIINEYMKTSGKIGKIIARYEDNYGNKYETEAEIDIKEIIENRAEKRLKSKTRIIYHGPFKKRIPMLLKTILIIGIVGIIAYNVTGSVIPIISGLGVYIVLEIILEIFYMRANQKYNDKEIQK